MGKPMEFVMVPVPEEHATEILRLVDRRIARGLREPWNAEALEAFFASSDEPTRAFLTLAAHAVIAEQELSCTEAAAALAMTEADLNVFTFEITIQTQELRRQNLFGFRRLAVEKGQPNDDSRRRIVMSEDIARWLEAAERNTEAADEARSTGTDLEPGQ